MLDSEHCITYVWYIRHFEIRFAPVFRWLVITISQICIQMYGDTKQILRERVFAALCSFRGHMYAY
jgi:hypothetical protein